MPTASIGVRRYNGELLAPDLLAGQNTLILSSFTEPVEGSFADNDGTLGAADDGVSRFNGDAVTSIGSGTVRAGIDLLGIIVPTGPAVDVVVFEAAGEIYFHFPDGQPSLLAAIAMIVEVEATPYEIFPNPYVGGPGADSFQGDGFNNIMSGASGNDSIDGGAGNDRIVGGVGLDTLAGGSGRDTIDGGGDADSLAGDAGNDRISGGGGADGIDGGSGSDSVLGGSGNDTIFGASGADSLYGQLGNDRINGDAGDDLISGGDGNDQLKGLDGEDRMAGDAGADLLFGGIGDDEVAGGTGNDTLNGGADDDVLMGQDGNDRLLGTGGTDILYGGRGNDVLTGGTEGDRFVFAFGQDRITDFVNADDIWLDGFLPLGTTGAEIVADFGAVVAGDAVFDFGGGRVLTVENDTTLASHTHYFALI
jgi:Ca2+-binding RTX toxin-like protein